MLLKHRTATLALLLLLLGAGLTAQRGSNVPAAVASFDRAIELLLDGKARRAEKPLREALRQDTSFLAARRMLGLAYELQGEYRAAARLYTGVIRRDSFFSRYLYFQTAEALYRAGDAPRALGYYEAYRSLLDRDAGDFGLNGEAEVAEEAAATARLADRIHAARVINDSTEFVNVTEVINLGFPVNTQQNDYFPFFANDRLSALITRQGEGGDEDLIRVRRRDLTADYFTSRFGSFNTTQPEGMLSLIRDGETVYFTLCHTETSQGGCDLYTGVLVGDRIRNVEPLPDYVNSPTWDSQAAISCDGRQLFFASTRPGGLGGSDLYYCNRQDDGTWSRPRNLGPGVNTPYNEEAPFISNDGETLYFSSEGHYSFGDQDIFTSWWNNKDNTWTQAINLGPPVNGPNRELGFHLASDGRTGFFASDRPGGRGGLDIYTFRLNHKLSTRDVTYVSGYVLDSLSGEPLPDVTVPVTGGATYRTNYAGRFFICAPSESVLPLRVDHPDYLPYDRSFAIPAWENTELYRIDLLLSSPDQPPPPPATAPPPPADTVEYRTRITKRNLTVRFSFDDASLTIRQIENIAKFVENIRDGNLISITVTGYTDSVGEDDYNIRLSQQRARAVGVHLKTAGITADEFNIKGVGEIPGSENRELHRKVEVQVRMRELVPVN